LLILPVINAFILILSTLLIQGARSVFNAKLRYTTVEQHNKKDYSRFTDWMFSLAESALVIIKQLLL